MSSPPTHHGSSHGSRPPIATTQSGSFRTRALAVSAAHRIATSPTTPQTQIHVHQGTPTSVRSGHSHHHQQGDIEANPLSPHSSNTPLSPTSPASGQGIGVYGTGAPGNAHMRHRRKSNHRHKNQNHLAQYRWLTTSAGGGTGDEPGVDVKSKRDEEAYGHLKNKTKVTVVDYSSNPDEDGTNLKCDFPGERLKEWLDSDHGKRRTNEDGRPAGVRWIHIDGLNWEVIKTLVLHYGLHPLAVEDSLRATNTPRSKLDFYRNHLYLQILIHHTTPADGDRLSMVADELAQGGGREEFIDDDNNSVLGTEDAEPVRKGGLVSKIGSIFRSERRVAKLPEGVEGVFEPSVVLARHAGGNQTFEKQAHTLTVNELSAKYMVPIRRGILSVFMLRDGTLISMDSKPTREVLAPIYGRLEDESSLLRRSGDVSMLAEAILDVAADLAIEISQTFEAEILKLEASVLVDPQMETVRHLHILSSQLIRLRRSLTPLLHVCYIVRDQDTQRSVAASAMVPTSGQSRSRTPFPGQMSGGSASGIGTQMAGQQHHGLTALHSHPSQNPNGTNGNSLGLGFGLGNTNGHNGFNLGAGMSPAPSRPGTPGPGAARGGGGNGVPVAPGMRDTESAMNLFGISPDQAAAAGLGFFSPMTKVYIGDVIDHLEIIVGSMEQFVATCDHLTDYVFNVLSFQTNESMERLSIVTVLFLPLTFIASYFGMNFDDFDALHQDVVYFWKIAIPCTAAFFVIFSFSYLRAFSETLYRKLMRWRRLKGMGSSGSATGRARVRARKGM
ncbi:hypothetical protein I317_02748 [Kwoniella heveanensis CBS 569]|nr:hypothetical protein I317_02748 [Kwoniella heveanensis CBS 569]